MTPGTATETRTFLYNGSNLVSATSLGNATGNVHLRRQREPDFVAAGIHAIVTIRAGSG